MKKFLKLFIASTMMISAFLFGAFIFATHAEETPAEETPTTSVVESTEPVATQDNATTAKEAELYTWLKSVDFEAVKGWVIAFMAKCGLDTSILLACLILFVKGKLKDTKENEKYQKFKEQLDAEHQKEIENLEKQFNDKLDRVYDVVIDTIKKQNSEKREIAKNNVDEMRAALGEIKVNLDE